MLQRYTNIDSAQTKAHTDALAGYQPAQMNALFCDYYCGAKWIFNIFYFVLEHLCVRRLCASTEVPLCNLHTLCIYSTHTHTHANTIRHKWMYVYNCNLFHF